MAMKEDNYNNDEMRAEIAKMLKEAKAEAKKIIEEAKSTAGGTLSADVIDKRKRDAEYLEEYVEVELFKDNGKYSDDVYVAVNGENCIIKRGEPVKIKRKFANVLEQSRKQDAKTSELIKKATEVKKIADL